MPHVIEIDRGAKIATTRCSGLFTMPEQVTMVQQLLEDPTLDGSYGLMFDCSRVDVPPTAEEIGQVAGTLRELNQKFPGKKAVVATLPGFLSLLEMIAMIAGDSRFEAFSNEQAATQWLTA